MVHHLFQAQCYSQGRSLLPTYNMSQNPIKSLAIFSASQVPLVGGTGELIVQSLDEKGSASISLATAY